MSCISGHDAQHHTFQLLCVCAFQTKAKCQREGGTWGLPVFGVNLEICFRGIISIDQGDFDSLRGSCTAPSNKHVCFTGCMQGLIWGIHNCMLHHTQRLTADMSGLVWHCRPFTQNARESNPTPIGVAVCGLVNIIMTLLSVISSVHRHDHWWFCGREVLTSYNHQTLGTGTICQHFFGNNRSVKAGSIIWS